VVEPLDSCVSHILLFFPGGSFILAVICRSRNSFVNVSLNRNVSMVPVNKRQGMSAGS